MHSYCKHVGFQVFGADALMGGMDRQNGLITTIFGLHQVHQSRKEICDDKFDNFNISMILVRFFIWGGRNAMYSSYAELT